MWYWIWQILTNKLFLLALLAVNIFGTIYGYIWYGDQLAETKPLFYIFVPDSPTATLFFSLAIMGWLLNQHWRIFEVLALVTLVKYGLWAVVMNLLALNELGTIGITGWMLVCSHFLMAVQGVLYLPKYDFKVIHIMIAAIWTLHNDVIDYVFGQMPRYSMLSDYYAEIGYFTFWMSILCLLLAIYTWHKKRMSCSNYHFTLK
ncbi:DUF1405 domain-containing protein [Kurthia sibirica]|uniref:DUF1405 domain-containing protein n=1 Tax=Kurthia sibirica TaxID=202750 RepID=A0A2U3AIT0_9BACL|nr:DUF1405 domain-containing protein [Kurthia sibirica]PWI24453.1 DUF1405 domain-containing protein [Kurthia sibirica]GEK35161.1 membrane protein [Kurthia sibirica]